MHAPAPKTGPKRLLFGRLAKSKRLRRIVVNSEALRDDFAESFPHTEPLLLLARNGADPIEPDPGPLAIARDGRFSVGYIGHLYPGRGMEILEEFAKLCPWAAFHVVGGWPDDVAFWKARIGDAPNVTFHGHVAPSRVPSFLRAMDVLIAPYQPVVGLEGGAGDNSRWVCPLKLFDYMAAGKPIICSDHPVLREILTHEQDALLCRPANVAQWVDSLRRLKDDRGLADELAAHALAKFKQHYSWDARARRVLEGLDLEGRS
jgi:glycosyltransferase involved in cell wall biosynthesis